MGMSPQFADFFKKLIDSSVSQLLAVNNVAAAEALQEKAQAVWNTEVARVQAMAQMVESMTAAGVEKSSTG